MEFWSALLGAVVGGMFTLAGVALQMRHERSLNREAAREQQREATNATNRAIAVDMLDLLALLESNFDGFRMLSPLRRAGQRPISGTDESAGEILDIMVRLEQSRGLLLPPIVSAAWYQLILLVQEYRGARVMQDEPSAWTTEQVERSKLDVLAYMTVVKRALSHYVRTLEPMKLPNPPRLQRESLTPWEAGDAPPRACM